MNIKTVCHYTGFHRHIQVVTSYSHKGGGSTSMQTYDRVGRDGMALRSHTLFTTEEEAIQHFNTVRTTLILQDQEEQWGFQAAA
ncbi:hypothetical protein [Kineobactrum salinum]|uniref:Uncharacterized protein n=1 Tax=Kineobactrum salinum TaxID=2708301 RepID=A0A6C0U598_9GAMM|nr:hypothetical protein [Kineobactrum salinum]QIB67156.1 hypothetical protein G3T16_18865 [Kineobactrum salinum]